MWTDAFRGIPVYRAAGAEKRPDPTGDLADMIDKRSRGRMDTEGVRVPIATLFDVAKRIQEQSEAIAALQGIGPALDADALAAHEAEQALLAERAAAKTGFLFEDGEGDWSALYGADGNVIEQGHVSSIRDRVVNEAWAVVRYNGDGCVDDDVGQWPDHAGAAMALVRLAERADG